MSPFRRKTRSDVTENTLVDLTFSLTSFPLSEKLSLHLFIRLDSDLIRDTIYIKPATTSPKTIRTLFRPVRRTIPTMTIGAMTTEVRNEPHFRSKIFIFSVSLSKSPHHFNDCRFAYCFCCLLSFNGSLPILLKTTI